MIVNDILKALEIDAFTAILTGPRNGVAMGETALSEILTDAKVCICESPGGLLVFKDRMSKEDRVSSEWRIFPWAPAESPDNDQVKAGCLLQNTYGGCIRIDRGRSPSGEYMFQVEVANIKGMGNITCSDQDVLLGRFLGAGFVIHYMNETTPLGKEPLSKHRWK